MKRIETASLQPADPGQLLAWLERFNEAANRLSSIAFVSASGTGGSSRAHGENPVTLSSRTHGLEPSGSARLRWWHF